MNGTPFERAVAQFLRHRGDALALAGQAAREAPESASAQLLEACLLLCSRNPRDFAAAAAPLQRSRVLRKSAGESAHEAAVVAAVAGDYPRAVELFDARLRECPQDAVALAVAHVFDYFLGNAASLRGRTARALAAWTPGLPAYHAVLSMHAFALQECGEYEAAEVTARRAVELEPRDLRAWHAVTHVLEMQGRAEEGLRWLGAAEACADTGGASTHLWWHRALLHLQLGEPESALAVYDRRIAGPGLSALIDGSALLWRLFLSGMPVEKRFQILAGHWAPHAEDAHCAFNDAHAMMAFAGAGRWDLARRLLAAQERRLATRGGANYDMTRLVGLPAARAIAAYGLGDMPRAEALLRSLPPVAHRIGGSHAQRDVFQLTRAAAMEKGVRAIFLKRGPRLRGDDIRKIALATS
jgi:tetratricopeptide (TPR) repeat protein